MAWYRTRCPVSTNAAGWINGSLDWCLAEFGSQTLNKPVLLPALDAVSTGYSGSGSDLESILARVCGRMGVDRLSILLETIPEEAHPRLLGQLPVQAMTSDGGAGHYFRREDKFVVSVSDDQLSTSATAAAVIAHELGHVRLLGEGRIDPERADREQLTDLVTVFFGLGVFNANAAFDFQQYNQGWRASHLGYLSEQMFGYALARYAQMRSEVQPLWARALDTNPRTYMKQATRYLEARGA